MTTVRKTSITSAGRGELLTDNEDFDLPDGVSIISTGDDAVEAPGEGGLHVAIDGLLFGELHAIDLNDVNKNAPNFNELIVGAMRRLRSDGGGAVLLDLEQIGGEGAVLIEGLAFGQVNGGDFLF